MPSSQHTKKLTIRLPDLELRRIKSLAALRGVTLQHAVRLALQAWASQPQPGTTSPDALASVALQTPTRQDHAAKRTQDKRRVADARPASRPMGQPHDLEEASLAWLRQAGKLDWSKCPAVESVPGKGGRIWVFRGTRVLLARAFRNLEEGRTVKEIAEAYGLTQQQVMAVLQFAAEGFALPASNR